MFKYTIEYTPKAKEHITKLIKIGDKSIIRKLDDLLNELRSHSQTGTGKPEF